tara:strand:+ start:1197 stop:1445 length:249 start_codon:yes stop_codon:yes gene_type:complete
MKNNIKKLSRELFDDNYQNNQVSNPSTKLQELRREIKKQTQLRNCTWCKTQVKKFKDQISVKEYFISGLCQDCQDKTFVEVE